MLGSHKDLVCSSDLEEAGLPGSWPSLPGSQTLAAATGLRSHCASSLIPAPGRAPAWGWGWGLCQAVEGSVVLCSGIQWQPWTRNLLGTTWPREQEVCTLWAFRKG